MADLSITGLEQVQRMLNDAPAHVVAGGYVKALQAASSVMEGALYAAAPERDEGERSEDTPHLRDEIVSDVALDSGLRGGQARIGFTKRVASVALWLEYGHRMVGHAPELKEFGFIGPHPFMRAAFDGAADQAIEAFADSLAQSVSSGLLGGKTT